MKRAYTPLLLLPLLLLLTSAGGYKTKYHYKKLQGREYAPINDTLYAGVYEVTQKEYKEFLKALNSEEYERCKIDSSQWVKKLPNSYLEPMQKNYHQHRAFVEYPVVNISWYAANKYCAWLTKNSGGEYTFYLPAAEEWNMAVYADAVTGLPANLYNGRNASKNYPGWYFKRYPYKVPDTVYTMNVGYISGDTMVLGDDGGYYTVLTDAYMPNGYGLYNMIGNAAEMTNIENVQKGGGWMDTLQNCTVYKTQHWQTPDPRVGFRVFAVKTK